MELADFSPAITSNLSSNLVLRHSSGSFMFYNKLARRFVYDTCVNSLATEALRTTLIPHSSLPRLLNASLIV